MPIFGSSFETFQRDFLGTSVLLQILTFIFSARDGLITCALCVDMNVTRDITLINNNNNSSKSFYQFDRRKRFFVRWTLERSQSVFCKARSPKVIVFCIYCVSEFLSKVVRGFRTLLCIYSQSFLIQHFTYKKLDE